MTKATRTEYGDRLRQAREHAQLKQSELADLVGVKQGTISGLEKTGQGSRHTTAIAQRCNVSATWLATGQGPMVPGEATEQSEAVQFVDLRGALLIIAEHLAKSDRFARRWEKVSRLLSDVAGEIVPVGTFARKLSPLLPVELSTPPEADNSEPSSSIEFGQTNTTLERMEKDGRADSVSRRRQGS